MPRPATSSNRALLGTLQLGQGRVHDALRIESGNEVEFSSTAALALGRSLVLDAPIIAANIGAQATVSAPYLEVGNQLLTTATLPNTRGGDQRFRLAELLGGRDRLGRKHRVSRCIERAFLE